MNNKRQKQDADWSALKREMQQLEDRMMDLQREYASLADLIEEQKMTLHQFDSCAADFDNTRQEWQWQLDGVLFYVCLTLEQQGLLLEDRMDILNNSVQYATLIHSILAVGEIEIASRSSTLTGDVDVQQEKLIEIHRTGTGDLVADVFSPGTTGQAVDYTLENPKRITVSPLTRGKSAEKLASNTAWNYVNAYAGGNAWKAMGQETLSQIMEAGLGYVPAWDEVNAVAGILEAGVNAELTDSAIADCRQIDRLSDVMSQFDLYYIQTDIDGSLDSYTAFMYPGADTEKRIQELNESIKANELCVSDLAVAGLPTELDLSYIMDHPDEVVQIIDIMVKSGWADPYAMDAFATVENQEEEK